MRAVISNPSLFRKRRSHIGVAFACACVFAPACGTDQSSESDASIAVDLGTIREDATPPDLAVQDAGVDPIDAAEAAGDADPRDALGEDVSPPDSGWGGCSVNGVQGMCVDVSTCTGDQVATPGHCPGPREIQCCTPRGAMFECNAADMPRPNEGLSEGPGEGGCPAGMLRIEWTASAFCIDRYEASLVELAADGSVVSSWSPYHHPGTRRVRAVSIAGAVPQGYVDQVVATAACEEAGKRLCSDAEWLRACRGPNDLIYPYGNTRMDGVCNDARIEHPAVELFPNDPNPFSRIQDACINQLPESLDECGVNSTCITADGAFDMMGNLHEWTADPNGTFRGGYYVDTYRNGDGCLYVTTAHNTLHWDYSTGFRCCGDAP